MFVLTPDELFRVALDAVETSPIPAFSPDDLIDDDDGRWLIVEGERHFLYDAESGDVTLCDHPCGDRITADSEGTMLITDADERVVRQRIPSVRLPDADSWMWAGFSDDGLWLVAGEPAGVQVFRRVADYDAAGER